MRTVIFDFDGTLADTFEIIKSAVNEVGQANGYPELQDTPEMRAKGAAQIAKELGVKPWQLPVLAIKVRALIYQRIGTAKLFPGIADALRRLRSECRVGVLTSNSEEAVRSVLEREGVIVDFIVSEKALFGKHFAIAKLLKRERLRKEEAIYVGDEIRDIEACRKAGVRVISVTWGFNSREGLERNEPDGIAGTPEELLRLLGHEPKREP